MTHTVRRAVVALAVAAAATGVGIQLANAQTTPTTPPTTVAPDDGAAPAPDATPEDRENCPDKDGAGRGERGTRPGADGGGAGRTRL
jgi:hypothetical protein